MTSRDSGPASDSGREQRRRLATSEQRLIDLLKGDNRSWHSQVVVASTR